MRTQVEIAKACGINPISLNAILGGRRNPSAGLAEKLEKETGIPREVWVWGTPEERRAAWSGLQDKSREAQP